MGRSDLGSGSGSGHEISHSGDRGDIPKKRRYILRSDTSHSEGTSGTPQTELQQAFRDFEDKNGGIFGRPSKSELSEAAVLSEAEVLGEYIETSLSKLEVKDREMLEDIVEKIKEKLNYSLERLKNESQGENNNKIADIQEDRRLYEKQLATNNFVNRAENNGLRPVSGFHEAFYVLEIKNGIKRLVDERRLSLSQTIEDALDECRHQDLQTVVADYEQKWKRQVEIRNRDIERDEKVDIQGLLLKHSDRLDTTFRSMRGTISYALRNYEYKSKEYNFLHAFIGHTSRLEWGIRYHTSEYLAEGQASLDILRTINAKRQDSTTKLYQLLQADSRLGLDVNEVYKKLKEIGIPIDTDQGESAT